VDWNLISALAAVGALFLAWQTVRETRALRREDRLARIPELVGEVGELALKIKQGAAHERNVYPVAQFRLKAAIAASGESFPACEEIATLAIPDPQSTEPFEAIQTKVKAALDELTLSLTAPDRTRHPGEGP
jgi:hypothetical protein